VTDINLDELIGWAREGGAIAQRLFRNVAGHRKADHTWVTEADVAIEQMLVARIAERYPDHGIIGEEQTRRSLDHEYLWALDPLDGTAVFLAGLPTWGISLGLLRHGQPYLGVIYFPMLDDCYWAMPGQPAFLNGQQIRVAPPHVLESDDWIATPSNTHRRYTIDFVGKTRTIGAIVGTLCYVARGSAVGGLFNRVSIWDVAAGLVILKAAGGEARTLAGAPIDTTTLLDGHTLAETMLLGSAEHIRTLQTMIRPRERA
jgi:myo-inositol-1(or 4)-monophosphatase